MVPEANKQQQRSTVDTLWTRLAFIFRCSSKPRATHRTNWQSKLMCNWAVVHFIEPVVLSAGEITRRRLSYITMADFQHAVFGTYYFSACKCKKKKKEGERNASLLGAAAFWRPFMTSTLYDEREEKHTFYSNFTVVNKGSHSPSAEAIPKDIICSMPEQKLQVICCNTRCIVVD